MHRLNTLLVAALMAAACLPTATSQTFENVYSLPDPGSHPVAPLIKTPTGSFLGTASGGGGNNFGSIFQVTPQGEVTRLVSFNGLNGLLPDGGLTLGNDGKYYGVTIGGGQGDRGTAFRVSAAGQFESLVNFSSISAPSPTGQIVQGSDGNFYGLCSDSVSNPTDAGAIFKPVSYTHLTLPTNREV